MSRQRGQRRDPQLNGLHRTALAPSRSDGVRLDPDGRGGRDPPRERPGRVRPPRRAPEASPSDLHEDGRAPRGARCAREPRPGPLVLFGVHSRAGRPLGADAGDAQLLSTGLSEGGSPLSRRAEVLRARPPEVCRLRPGDGAETPPGDRGGAPTGLRLGGPDPVRPAFDPPGGRDHRLPRPLPHLREDYADIGFPEEAITVIPHFYDDHFYRSSATVDEPAEPFSLLYVGALQDIKGVDTLVRALALLEQAGHQVELRIAGRGPYEQTLRSLATELDVAESVTWYGYVDHDELPDLYADSDAFVYPGVIDEPFGRVMLEALASHTPILSSDVGSMDYIVGPAGALFEPGNERSLVRAFETLRENYVDHQQAISHQLERFSSERVIDALSSLYADTALSNHAV
ncbi:glycosyltransferase [Halalkalicoccus salilacus]|uniref:glycosyltransferase n=1 Tax=Halalkalicoccus sp. GCM10025704 TaxID=3252662 RepID=UPI0036071D6E